MAAPGGFEDDDDFDEEGFCLGSEFDAIRKPKAFDPVVHSSTAPRGGFGHVKPKAKEPEKKFRRVTDLKEEADTIPLTVGDFQMAIVRGHTDKVKQYINQGFEVDSVLKSGWTGLMYAASNANMDITSLLLENGADANVHKDMYTVLMAACGASGYTEEDVLGVVNLLLGKGANVNAYDRYHTSPVMYAAREGRAQVIECLAKAGANINKQDNRGLTSLTWAVTRHQSAAVRMLVQLGADPQKKHSDGQTVLDLAETNEDTEMLEILEGKKHTSPHKDLTLDLSVNTEINKQPRLVKSDSVGTTYGELELFLCGLDLSQLVDVVRAHHIDFNTLLTMTEEDLIKIGVSQLGIRKKILDGIHSVHKKDWDNASLPTMHYNKQVSCGEALAMVANISKHIKYICTTMAYLQNQLSRSPAILEQLQDGTGPKQLHKHTVDTIHNLTSLQTQLGTLKLQLEQMLEKGNYDPPDLIHAPPPTSNSRRRLVPMVILSGALLVTLVWNKDAISQWIGREPS